MIRLLLAWLLLLAPPAWAEEAAGPWGDLPVYGYEVIASYPHDRGAFTQGLVFAGGELYESTGLRGRSTLRRVDLESGEVEEVVHLPDRFFGEGLTAVGDRLYQLTWRSRLGLVYDLAGLEVVDRFHYPTEGWGLTHDGRRLILSDGTAALWFMDPGDFQIVNRCKVAGPSGPISHLNELEYINGEVWANVWQTDFLARIDPETCRATGVVDLSGLSPEPREGGVLNGIAYDPAAKRLLVTGKLWPRIFEIRVVPRPPAAVSD